MNVVQLRVPSVNMMQLRLPSVNVVQLRVPSGNVVQLRVPSVNVVQLRVSSVNVVQLRVPSVNVVQLRVPSVNVVQQSRELQISMTARRTDKQLVKQLIHPSPRCCNQGIAPGYPAAGVHCMAPGDPAVDLMEDICRKEENNCAGPFQGVMLVVTVDNLSK